MVEGGVNLGRGEDGFGGSIWELEVEGSLEEGV